MNNEPAYPIVSKYDLKTGLTKREYFAAKIIPTLLEQLYTRSLREGRQIDDVYKVASIASVQCADALLEALNESK